MFSRVWQTFASWFGLNANRALPITKKKQKKERFLIIEDPFLKTHFAPGSKQRKTQYAFPKNSDDIMHLYKIQCNLQPQNRSLQKQARSNDEFIFEMKKMSKALQQIEFKSNQILTDSSELTQEIDGMMNKIKKVKFSEQNEKYKYKQYVKIVLNVIDTKYTGERINYPNIPYKNFERIIDIWDNHEKNQQFVHGYDHLRYSNLSLLGPKRWLNDQVIYHYINLMNQRLSKKQNNPYIIFNSLKVTSLFDKSDFKKIQKIIEKQNVTRKTSLVLAIHKKNHWIFIKMQNQSICIYDSMKQQSTQNYSNFPLIGNIIRFAATYYGAAPPTQIVSNFPQQKNGYDCGMMMLCGIKDVVRDSTSWSFSQKDMPYKRALVTHELLEKNITGF